MSRVLAIAQNTFKEAVRNRILYIILFFAVILIGVSGVVSELTISDRSKIVKDLGFTAIDLFGIAIAVFVGVGLVYNELEKKSIYTIVSKPIDRWQFLMGKYLGLLLTIYVTILVMTIFFLFTIRYNDAMQIDVRFRLQADWSYAWVWKESLRVAFVGLVDWNAHESTRGVMQVIVMTMVELAVVTAFAIFYSSFSTPTLSMFFTVLTFIAGRMNEDIIGFADLVSHQAIAAGSTATPLSFYLGTAAAIVMPNLEGFQRAVDRALYGAQPSIELYMVFYGVCYALGVLLLAVLIFGRRNFK